MPPLHVLRVFTGEDGSNGNKLGVFLEGSEVPPSERQGVAAELGFSETVFLLGAERGELQIFTPAVEFPFAGHPLVGTAWLLGSGGAEPSVLRPPAGEVPVRFDGEQVFIAGDPAWSPPSEYVRMDSAPEVEALSEAPLDTGDVFAWAWISEDEGTIRARCFAPAVGIREDEATGSAVLTLCAELGRPIVVHQGEGSVLRARPLDGGLAEVGGRVALDELRDY